MNQEETVENSQEVPLKPPRRRLRPTDLSKVSQKMQMILEREINRLFDESATEELSENSHKKFLNYLKFLPDLRKQEDEDLENLSDEELNKLQEKLTKKGNTRVENS